MVIAIGGFDDLNVIKQKKKKRKTVQDVAGKFRKLRNEVSPVVQGSLVKGFRTFKSKAVLAAILDAMRKGKIADIDKIAPWDEFENDLGFLKDDASKALLTGAVIAEGLIPKVIKPKFRFDATNPRISKWIQDNTGNSITTFKDVAQKASKVMVEESFKRGIPARRAADMLKNHGIGLTVPQAKSMTIFAEKLQKQGVTGTQFERLIKAERKRKEAIRFKVLARTEIMNAINAGVVEVHQQMVDKKLIDPKLTLKEWVVAPDNKPDICTPMDGNTVPFNEPWNTPVGALQIPSMIHPNCNCTMVIKPGFKRRK